MTPTPCMMDAYHGDSFPYPSYNAPYPLPSDASGFAQMVAGGWPFFVSKISQGSFDRDTKAVGRLAAAAGVMGMYIGGYHFMDDSPIHAQAGNFMGACAQVMAAAPRGTFLRLVVDNEPSTLGLAVTSRTDKMASMMAQAMYAANHRFPLIYGDASEFYAPDSFLSQCPRWLAKYGPWATPTQWGPGWSSGQWQQFSDGTTNAKPAARFAKSYDFGRHQMLSTLAKDSVPGFVGTPLDMSAFSGSVAEAIATWAI